MKERIKEQAKRMMKAMEYFSFVLVMSTAVGFGFVAGAQLAHDIYVKPAAVVDEDVNRVATFVPFAGVVK